MPGGDTGPEPRLGAELGLSAPGGCSGGAVFRRWVAGGSAAPPGPCCLRGQRGLRGQNGDSWLCCPSPGTKSTGWDLLTSFKPKGRENGLPGGMLGPGPSPLRTPLCACFQTGDVCISILHPPVDDPQSGELPSERWNPTQNVRYGAGAVLGVVLGLGGAVRLSLPVLAARTILLSVISLLNEPNTFSPANVDASVMYRKWKESKGKDREYTDIIRCVGAHPELPGSVGEGPELSWCGAEDVGTQQALCRHARGRAVGLAWQRGPEGMGRPRSCVAA